MDINETLHGNYVTLSPVGDLDANSSVHFDQKISELFASGQYNIHVDGSSVPYISSAGLGVFVSHLEDLTAYGGKFVISGLSDTVTDVFRILGLDQLSNLVVVKSDSEVPSQFDS